ncbi:MAG: HIT domain-containing protein [Thermodesulfobacteriota bacterium]
MRRLRAPWRIKFIKPPPPENCLFCQDPYDNPQESFVLYSDKLTGEMLNRYPYNNGPLLIYPLSHTPNIEGLSQEEGAHLFRLTQASVGILRETLHSEGFNVGVYRGKVAGAGIDDRIHYHVVPRWTGDVNFMPLLADVKVIPQHLEDSYRQLSSHFQRISTC